MKFSIKNDDIRKFLRDECQKGNWSGEFISCHVGDFLESMKFDDITAAKLYKLPQISVDEAYKKWGNSNKECICKVFEITKMRTYIGGEETYQESYKADIFLPYMITRDNKYLYPICFVGWFEGFRDEFGGWDYLPEECNRVIGFFVSEKNLLEFNHPRKAKLKHTITSSCWFDSWDKLDTYSSDVEQYWKDLLNARVD